MDGFYSCFSDRFLRPFSYTNLFTNFSTKITTYTHSYLSCLVLSRASPALFPLAGAAAGGLHRRGGGGHMDLFGDDLLLVVLAGVAGGKPFLHLAAVK